MIEDAVRDRQSKVVESGGDWEDYLYGYLKDKLKSTGIEIYNTKEVRENPVLKEYFSTILKMSQSPKSIIGDIDLVAATKNNVPIAIISCKTSLHGRFTETLFYSVLFHALSKIKVVLATPDAGRQSSSGKWESEWGTDKQPTKDRLLAESYLDGVYVENVKEFCKNIKSGEKTDICGIVQPLKELPDDIVTWGKDISKRVSKRSSIFD